MARNGGRKQSRVGDPSAWIRTKSRTAACLSREHCSLAARYSKTQLLVYPISPASRLEHRDPTNAFLPRPLSVRLDAERHPLSSLPSYRLRLIFPLHFSLASSRLASSSTSCPPLSSRLASFAPSPSRGTGTLRGRSASSSSTTTRTHLRRPVSGKCCAAVLARTLSLAFHCESCFFTPGRLQASLLVS